MNHILSRNPEGSVTVSIVCKGCHKPAKIKADPRMAHLIEYCSLACRIRRNSKIAQRKYHLRKQNIEFTAPMSFSDLIKSKSFQDEVLGYKRPNWMRKDWLKN